MAKVAAMATAFGCAVLSTCLSGAQQHSLAFDDTLHTVMRASANDFRSIGGARVENRLREFYFEAQMYLPEATYCRIMKDQASVYCCEWGTKRKADLEPLYEKLVTQVEGALGKTWTRISKSGKLRSETLFGAEGKPSAQVILEPGRSQIYVLVLKAGSSKDGYTGTIPTTESFLLRR